MSEYGSLNPPNEGFVYWAGKINEDKIIINSVFAPDTLSSEGSVEIKSRSNFDFVLFLSNHKLSHIANIHTHSGSWVGHSTGDDFMAPFKKPGLLSIVVPNYGTKKNLFCYTVVFIDLIMIIFFNYQINMLGIDLNQFQ